MCARAGSCRVRESAIRSFLMRLLSVHDQVSERRERAVGGGVIYVVTRLRVCRGIDVCVGGAELFVSVPNRRRMTACRCAGPFEEGAWRQLTRFVHASIGSLSFYLICVRKKMSSPLVQQPTWTAVYTNNLYVINTEPLSLALLRAVFEDRPCWSNALL